jgi:hypothetical protein
MLIWDWEALVSAARERPLVAALFSLTIFFCIGALFALMTGHQDMALGGGMLMVLFHFLNLLAQAES